ncbi:MAG: hypothetical protein EA377_03890 [Phycisphaerales bacterium]|nr:MAG: hypothetical protein EA377_03890 [Phycisphaerales bacterium]
MSKTARQPGRINTATKLLLSLLSVAIILISVNVFFQRGELRSRIDATQTRAYSLSEQTRQILNDLEGDWTIALLVIEEDKDASLRRQIDEVLDRITRAAPNIRIERIDPTDPASVVAYESLLSRLRSAYADLVAMYDEELDRGRALFEDLLLYAQQHSGQLEELAQMAGRDDGVNEIVQRAQVLALLGEEGHQVLDEVDQVRAVGEQRPIPDYDFARSTLVQALTVYANEMDELAEQARLLARNPGMPPEIRSFLNQSRREYDDWAQRLMRTADPLRQLPELELATIGRQLAEGEAAVVLGPERAAVIPGRQLFPPENVRQLETGQLTYDQRFRGEQLFASAIRALLTDTLPRVVFAHGEDRSLFRPDDRSVDLVGVATLLHSARYDVEEWRVHRDDRPTGQDGQPTVWVIIAPPQRTGLEPSDSEVELLRTARDLIADGESVLVSIYPSMLPRYGQPDPWAKLTRPFGVTAETSSVIYESIRTGADRREVLRHQHLQRFERGHPISGAVHGLQTYFGVPVPLRFVEEIEGTRTVLAQVEPGRNRWLESDWSADPQSQSPPDDERRFTEAVPIVVSVERPHALRDEPQRAILIGSGGWMLSFVADAAEQIGATRTVLRSPGNYELMQASVAWLAGHDDLIAPSPASQEVARLEEISDGAHRAWMLGLVIGMPLTCLLLAMGVWAWRRV